MRTRLFAAAAMFVLLLSACDDAANFESAETEAEKERGAAHLLKLGKENGAVTTRSGLVVVSTQPGNGASPTARDRVKVHYTGKLIDGTTFDSSVNRGPAVFPLQGVIKCWTEGLQLMKAGEAATLGCPSDLAYGDGGRQGAIPGGATLIFDVELIEVIAPNDSPSRDPE